LRLAEGVESKRQGAAEPCGVIGVVSQIIAGAGVEKDRQTIAVEHEPWQE